MFMRSQMSELVFPVSFSDDCSMTSQAGHMDQRGMYWQCSSRARAHALLRQNIASGVIQAHAIRFTGFTGLDLSEASPDAPHL